jgi:N6-L-threonylcarbamoyladenine synthase
MAEAGLGFSFSGLKSAVMRYLAANTDTETGAVSYHVPDVCASFVAACLDVLVAKCRRALLAYPARSLVVVGGVAASPPLRAEAGRLCDELGIELCLPPLRWSTDNGAMIALATWDYLATGRATPLAPQTGLRIDSF